MIERGQGKVHQRKVQTSRRGFCDAIMGNHIWGIDMMNSHRDDLVKTIYNKKVGKEITPENFARTTGYSCLL